MIVEYQVGLLETIRYETEKAQGAPDRSEHTAQTIYTERAAKVSNTGQAIDMVRRYDKLKIVPAPPRNPSRPPLLQDMTIWYHLRTGRVP